MLQRDQMESVRIEGTGGEPTVELEWQPDAVDLDTGDGALDGLSAQLGGEAARQMLVGAGPMLAELTEQVGMDIGERAERIQRGEGESKRDDLIYQSPDWERAAGRADNSVDELIG